ncbi:hypothetical protein RPPS3_02900 [Rhodopseudomonas palustris]|nr:hypothetical protein RPPS3_02900 [Rhodopseudomonas palustris]
MPSMRSDASATALSDIQHHIELAIVFTRGLTETEFKNDLRTVYAVTRCLEIISEASRRVSEDIKNRHSSIPWKQIAGSGNVYRHDYEDVAAQMIWDTVQRALPALKAMVAEELARRDEQRPQ